MHQQIKASPDDTAGNVRRVVNALAREDINIEAIAPDFDPPHVRVLVDHFEPYDETNVDDPFNKALAALVNADLNPQVVSALPVNLPNKPRALQTVLDRLMRRGFVVESVLVLPGEPAPGIARVSFGVARSTVAGWDDEFGDLAGEIEQELDALPDG